MFSLTKDWTVGKLFGIPFIITGAWKIFMLAIFFLTAVPISLRGGLSSEAIYTGAAVGGMAVVFLLVVYAFVVLHEFGHGLTAQWFGYSCESIRVLPFMGLARIDMPFDKPKAEFWVTINGPMVNVALALLFWPLALKYPNIILIQCLELNVILALFNMLPIFPMDGGRIFRSMIGGVTGNHWMATRFTFYWTLLVIPIACVVAWNLGWYIACFLFPFMGLMAWGEYMHIKQDIDQKNYLDEELRKMYPDATEEELNQKKEGFVHFQFLQEQVFKAIARKHKKPTIEGAEEFAVIMTALAAVPQEQLTVMYETLNALPAEERAARVDEVIRRAGELKNAARSSDGAGLSGLWENGSQSRVDSPRTHTLESGQSGREGDKPASENEG